MKIIVLDSTAVVEAGPGSPAYFSRFAIEHLRAQGHEIMILPAFAPTVCHEADLVWSEWVNEPAYEAAASGMCKRLVLRMRGYDAFGPLDRLEWGNVDALVYESPFLKDLVEERFAGLRGFRSHVIPSGVDVANIVFKPRQPGPVVAMVGRGVADKGFQLAFEWARQRPDIRLHAALALPEPRLLRYLKYTRPPNVTIYDQVDTVKWLDEIDANYLLSASSWESLGYTIAEALAMGIMPLVHGAPGASLNWPLNVVEHWWNFEELNYVTEPLPSDEQLARGRPRVEYDSHRCRAFVEEHLDAAKQSKKFADLALNLPARTVRTRDTVNDALAAAIGAVENADLAVADQRVVSFRGIAPASPALVDHRVGLALRLAARYYAADDLAHARTWALRAMMDGPRPDAFALLGEISIGENDLEQAERWYEAAAISKPVPSRYGIGLVEGAVDRFDELRELTTPSWYGYEEGACDVKRFLIVVAVRNAEKYIGDCLRSVKEQTTAVPFLCVVVDDTSTDGTLGAIADAVGTTTLDTRFRTNVRKERFGSLRNIVSTLHCYSRPGDVIVILDGDDTLTSNALERIQIEYESGAWLTYGNFVSTSGKPSWMPPYPRAVLNEGRVRDYPWQVSHPKTFRYELFHRLTDEDFTHDGKWFQTAGDVALMLPLLELAGDRAVYIPDVIYVYNDQNPANDHRVDPDGQVRVRDLIYAKARKTKLEGL